MERVYEPGNGVRERIDELRAARQRLRSDRDSGLYDAPDDADWFRSRYAAMGRELEKLEREPVREPGMVMRPTGETVEDRWFKAPDNQARKEILREFGVLVTIWSATAPRRWHAGIVHGPERREQP